MNNFTYRTFGIFGLSGFKGGKNQTLVVCLQKSFSNEPAVDSGIDEKNLESILNDQSKWLFLTVLAYQYSDSSKKTEKFILNIFSTK